jgi:hypothetical protein
MKIPSYVSRWIDPWEPETDEGWEEGAPASTGASPLPTQAMSSRSPPDMPASSVDTAHCRLPAARQTAYGAGLQVRRCDSAPGVRRKWNHVMRPSARCTLFRKVSSRFSQRTSRLRKRFIHE